MLVIYAVLIAATAYLLVSTPKGFIPVQDRGYLVVIVQLPDGASLERTNEISQQIEAIALEVPGVDRVPTFSGFSMVTGTSSSNSAGLAPVFQPWSVRKVHGLTSDKIAEDLRERLKVVSGATVIVATPPPVQGLGSTGGFSMRLQDTAGLGTEALAKATDSLIAAANATEGMTGVYSPFSARTPQVFVELDRERAEMLGVPSSQINQAIETYFGSSYINDFNLVGRTYRVTAQADLPYRVTPEDLARVKVRNDAGQMVPIASVTRLHESLGVDRFPRYNLFPTAEINGDTLPGLGSEFGIKTMERLAKETLPAGITYQWTDLSYQQTTAGNMGLLVFPLCVIFVYLVLAAQYESLTDPLIILITVPLSICGALIPLALGYATVNIYTQIGLVTLIGLISKHGILMVEFANALQVHEQLDRISAIRKAAQIRLRPILMTTAAMVVGLVPLLFASGAGANSRFGLGVVIVSGMLIGTFFTLFVLPTVYTFLARRHTADHATPRARDLSQALKESV